MRVAIYTLGCKVNQYETQAMEQELLRRGHTLVPAETEADGYIVNTDTTPLKKQYEEMHKIGININQIAKKVNTTGDLYPEEMQELKEMVKELWHILRSSPLK